MSLALSFLGGAPFQLLFDAVKEAISSTRNFRTQLMSVQFTLECLQPHILQQIRANNVQLNLPDDIIRDLELKMHDGVLLVASLARLSMWNVRIWGNCCGCLEPNYAAELEELDNSLKILLERLRVEQMRNITLLMLQLNDVRRGQSDILLRIQDIQGQMSRSVQQQQQVIQQMQVNAAQQGGAASVAAPMPLNVGQVFGTLYDTVTKVKVKNLMFSRLVEEIKYSLDCLKPIIDGVSKSNNEIVLHLPMLELEDFATDMQKAVEYVEKCSKISKLSNYTKYPWTNNLVELYKNLQRLFIDFREQVEGKVKMATEVVSNVEGVINQIKGELVEIDEIQSEVPSPPLQPGSPSAPLELEKLQETSTMVSKKTPTDATRVQDEELDMQSTEDVHRVSREKGKKKVPTVQFQGKKMVARWGDGNSEWESPVTCARGKENR